MITFTPVTKINNFPQESKTFVIAKNIYTAERIMNYLNIKHNTISWVDSEISAKGQPNLPYNQNHWMGIYNLIKN